MLLKETILIRTRNIVAVKGVFFLTQKLLPLINDDGRS
jgi:hypothetical protein